MAAPEDTLIVALTPAEVGILLVALNQSKIEGNQNITLYSFMRILVPLFDKLAALLPGPEGEQSEPHTHEPSLVTPNRTARRRASRAKAK